MTDSIYIKSKTCRFPEATDEIATSVAGDKGCFVIDEDEVSRIKKDHELCHPERSMLI